MKIIVLWIDTNLADSWTAARIQSFYLGNELDLLLSRKK